MDVKTAAALRTLDPVELGRRIRDLRVARGLTQAKVAGDTMSVAYVSRIESGSRRPEPQMLAAIADRLGATVEYLTTGVEPRKLDEARLQLRYAELSLESGEAAEAERASAALLADPEVAALPEIGGRVAYVHARALEVGGRLEEAASELEALRERGADLTWVHSMTALCRCYREAGDLNRSIEVGEQALHRLAEVGLEGSSEAVQLELTVAAAYFERGDEVYAIARCRKSADRAEALGPLDARAAAYWNASVMESRRGGHLAAITLAERALALMGEGSDARNVARLRSQLGTMLLRSGPGQVDEAIRHLKAARAALTAASGGVVDVARCDTALAEALARQGDLEGAAELAAQAISAAGAASPLLEAEARMVLGHVALLRRDEAAALEQHRAAAARLTAAGADRAAGQVWFELAAALDASGDHIGARDAYRNAAAAAGLRVPAAPGNVPADGEQFSAAGRAEPASR